MILVGREEGGRGRLSRERPVLGFLLVGPRCLHEAVISFFCKRDGSFCI